MTLRQLPRYDDLRLAPELAALAILEAALAVARSALLADNPKLGDIADNFQGRTPPLGTALAALLVARADELYDLLGWYRAAVAELQRQPELDDLPF